MVIELIIYTSTVITFILRSKVNSIPVCKTYSKVDEYANCLPVQLSQAHFHFVACIIKS
jgi:hypothetical protein